MNQTLNPFAEPHFMISPNSGPYLAPLIGFFVMTMLVVWLIAGTAICRYTGLTRGKSALLWMLAIGLSICLGLSERAASIRHYQNTGKFESFTLFEQICALVLPLLAIPFAVRIYRKLIGGQLTEPEKLPGMDGVRAWLTPGNLICAILIPICASVPQMFILTFGSLLIYPVLNMLSTAVQPAPVVPPEDLSSEREKVLQLLEAGKISAVESAELLNALNHSAPPPPKPAAEINPQRKIVLLGAALLLVGFFLPWFVHPILTVNPQTNFSFQTGALQIHAGDIPHGLGWWILALGIAAAVLPFFATTLEAALQKKIILAALGVGTILLIYSLSEAIEYVSFGIILALAGYVLELVGTLKERPSAR
jgi:SHOCT-like protein